MIKISKHKTKAGKFVVTIRGRTPDGESFRDRRVAPTSSKSGTERWAQDRERFLLTGGAEKAKTKIKEVPTLAEFEPRFIEQYAIANRLKPSTVDTYRSRLRLQLLPTLGAVRLNAIDKSAEQRLKASLAELDPSTVNNVLGVLSKLLNAALDWGVITGLPVKLSSLRTSRKAHPFYDFEQFERVVEAATATGPERLAVILLGGEAGLRRGEIAGLEWTDVDFALSQLTVQRTIWKGQVTTPKGGRSRVVPMTKRLARALHNLRHLRGTRVFYEDGKPIAEGTVNNWMAPLLRRAGMPATRQVHILRHTFCSHLAMRGAPATAIQELAGHTDLSTTMRYMHLSPASRQAAIDLLEQPAPEARIRPSEVSGSPTALN